MNKPLSGSSINSLATLSFDDAQSLFAVQKACYHDDYSGGRGYGGNQGYNRGGFDRNEDNYDYRSQHGGFQRMPREGGYGMQRGGGYGMRGGDRFGDMGSRLQKQDFSKLEPIKKDFYQESELVANRPDNEIQSYLDEQQVTVTGNGSVRPIMTFEEAPFSGPIKEKLVAYPQPTVIQAISWPLALSGRDIISIAKTGSGKTLAFILPAIVHIMNQAPKQPGDGPTALVLAPTRELAQQVEQVAQEYCSLMSMRTVSLYGGASKGPQAEKLRRGVDICIACPGRLVDILSDGITNLLRCSYLVLDEADRMLDMGFEPQIRKVVSQIRPDRQTLMFSATWPKEVRELARDFQKDAVRLNVGSDELAANPNITQHVEVIEKFKKSTRLTSLIREIMNDGNCRALIFVQTKRMADQLTMEMRRNNVPAMSIHGDKSQGERDYAMQQFRSGNTKFLIATDVAARGLDVPNISHVINYDYPNNAEDYVHRIGRTARGNNTGSSYTFFTYDDYNKASELVRLLQQANQDVPEDLMKMVPQSNQRQARY